MGQNADVRPTVSQSRRHLGSCPVRKWHAAEKGRPSISRARNETPAAFLENRIPVRTSVPAQPCHPRNGQNRSLAPEIDFLPENFAAGAVSLSRRPPSITKAHKLQKPDLKMGDSA